MQDRHVLARMAYRHVPRTSSMYSMLRQSLISAPMSPGAPKCSLRVTRLKFRNVVQCARLKTKYVNRIRQPILSQSTEQPSVLLERHLSSYEGVKVLLPSLWGVNVEWRVSVERRVWEVNKTVSSSTMVQLQLRDVQSNEPS
jgi:hypothetical protein